MKSWSLDIERQKSLVRTVKHKGAKTEGRKGVAISVVHFSESRIRRINTKLARVILLFHLVYERFCPQSQIISSHLLRIFQKTLCPAR